MAPRNMAGLDCNRYLLRTCKQQSTNGKIDASSITTKVEFLRFLGLTTSENINSKCEICRNSICKCSDSVIDMANEYNRFTFKECWVVVTSEKCTICRKIFKCQSDLDNHIRKKHKKISKKRTRIVLKIGHEVVTENYVKKRYLQLSNNNSKIISSEDKNMANNSDDIPVGNPLSPIIDTPTIEPTLVSDESSEDKRCASAKIKPTEFNYPRNRSTSSSDSRVELLNCPDSCACCRENITLQKHKDHINSQDQNNNNDSYCNNNYYSSEVNNNLSMNDDDFTNSNSNLTSDNTLLIDNNNDNCSSETEDIECCSRSVSVQTPSYWDYRTFTLLEYSRALEANQIKDKSIIPAKTNQEENIITIDDDIEVSILEDKFKKLNDQPVNNSTEERDDFSSTENDAFSIQDNDTYSIEDSDEFSMEDSDNYLAKHSNNYSMDESDDDSEVQEISQTTKQPLKQSLRITDAIQSLIDTENSMQDYVKLNNKKKYDDIDIDDDISYMRMQMHKEIDSEYVSFDISKLEKQIDENDVSIVPLLDCEEKNYNISINGDYDYVDYELASLKQLAKTKSINDEFDNESRSWEKPDRNRLSITTTPIQFFNHNNSSILIKEEVSIDHFTFDRE